MSKLPNKRVSKRKVFFEEEIILPQAHVPKKTKKIIAKFQEPKKKGRPRKNPLPIIPIEIEGSSSEESTEVELMSPSPVKSPKKQKQKPKENKSLKEKKTSAKGEKILKPEKNVKSEKKPSKETTKQSKGVKKVKIKLPVKLSKGVKKNEKAGGDRVGGDKGFKCSKINCSNKYLTCFR